MDIFFRIGAPYSEQVSVNGIYRNRLFSVFYMGMHTWERIVLGVYCQGAYFQGVYCRVAIGLGGLLSGGFCPDCFCPGVFVGGF